MRELDEFIARELGRYNGSVAMAIREGLLTETIGELILSRDSVGAAKMAQAKPYLATRDEWYPTFAKNLEKFVSKARSIYAK